MSDVAGPGSDLLGRGSDRPRRPATARVAALVAALLVVGLLVAGLLGGYPVRQHRPDPRDREFETLLARTRDAQESIAYAQRRVTGMVQYTSPMLTSARAPVPVRSDMERLVREAAGAGAATVRQSRSALAVAAGGRFADAGSAYLVYVDDWLAFLDATSRSVDELYRSHRVLRRELEQARLAFIRDAPTPAAAARARTVLVDP